MKITKRQLKRIIREEKRKLTENYGSDSVELEELATLAYRSAEELEANEAYQRMIRGEMRVHPKLAKLVEDAVSKLRAIDEWMQGPE
jgi:hypothetical protein